MLVLRKWVGAQTHLSKLLFSSKADHGFSWLVEAQLYSEKHSHPPKKLCSNPDLFVNCGILNTLLNLSEPQFSQLWHRNNFIDGSGNSVTVESLAKYLFHIVTDKEIIIVIIFASIYSSVFTFMWAQRREWQPTPVFLLGEFNGQRSLVGYSPQSHRVQHNTGIQGHKEAKKVRNNDAVHVQKWSEIA